MKFVLGGLGVSALLVATFLVAPSPTVHAPTEKGESVLPPTVTEEEPASLFFVGDMMLGRSVELFMEEHGTNYPFRHVGTFISAPDLAVGNFEGVVAREHVRTPSMTFKFSIKEEYLRHLGVVGFDVLSLANNHSLDYGEEALSFTKGICREESITCAGFPNRVGEDSFAVREVGLRKIGFVFLSTVWGEPDEEELVKLVDMAREKSTFLVAYVHWGDEYELVHSPAQERLAKWLVDRGVDLVVGHHPHVVQDVGIYRGRAIFYSLGNFVFDQWFSDEVTEGLGVGLTLTDTYARYRLTTFRNDTARSQPHTVSSSESLRLFSRILAGIADEAGVEAKEGILLLPNN